MKNLRLPSHVKHSKPLIYLFFSFIFLLFSALVLHGQPELFKIKKHGIHLLPAAIIDSRGEIHAGYSHYINKKVVMDITGGSSFKSSNDPNYELYETETYLRTTVKECKKTISHFLLIPYNTTDGCAPLLEPDIWIQREQYINHHFSLDVGFKYFYASFYPELSIPEGMYIGGGFKAGVYTYDEYTRHSGTIPYGTLLSSSTSGGSVFGGTITETNKYQLEIYDFKKLEKEVKNYTYLTPYLQLGLQIPIGDFLNINAGGVVYQGIRKNDLSTDEKVRLTYKLAITWWL